MCQAYVLAESPENGQLNFYMDFAARLQVCLSYPETR